jgi:L-threonylcarbamoyladenylate synthase
MLLNFEQTVRFLKDEKIVAIPTETVYGLAGVATSVLAIEKIYKAKNRPVDNPLICHFYSASHILEYVKELPQAAEKILALYPEGGPFSLLLQLKDQRLAPATRGLKTVICRIPQHKMAREIIKAVGLPLAAPSANTSGRLSPTSAEMVEADLGTKIDGIFDGGPSQVGLESTILDLNEPGLVKILRPGGLTFKKLAEIFPEAKIVDQQTKQTTPGAKYRHYSPRAEVIVIEELNQFKKPGTLVNLDPQTADKNFYQSLFEADQKGAKKIYFLKKPGFSKALINRLEKMKD